MAQARTYFHQKPIVSGTVPLPCQPTKQVGAKRKPALSSPKEARHEKMTTIWGHDQQCTKPGKPKSSGCSCCLRASASPRADTQNTLAAGVGSNSLWIARCFLRAPTGCLGSEGQRGLFRELPDSLHWNSAFGNHLPRQIDVDTKIQEMLLGSDTRVKTCAECFFFGEA